MKCPVCDERLVQVQRGDILVELCQSCRGAWVERLDLEKVLAILSEEGHGSVHATEDTWNRDKIEEDHRPRRWRDIRDDDDDDEHYDGRSDHYGRKRKRGGLLGSIADMFGG